MRIAAAHGSSRPSSGLECLRHKLRAKSKGKRCLLRSPPPPSFLGWTSVQLSRVSLTSYRLWNSGFPPTKKTTRENSASRLSYYTREEAPKITLVRLQSFQISLEHRYRPKILLLKKCNLAPNIEENLNLALLSQPRPQYLLVLQYGGTIIRKGVRKAVALGLVGSNRGRYKLMPTSTPAASCLPWGRVWTLTKRDSQCYLGSSSYKLSRLHAKGRKARAQPRKTTEVFVH